MNMETVAKGAVHVPAGEGESVWLVGDTYTFKATSENTNGSLVSLEATVPPQGGPPPHIHHREDESFYLLEGELEFLGGERTFVASAGSFVYLPKGTLHAFKNVGTEIARMVVLITPAGMDRFFFEVGRPAFEGGIAPPPGPEDIEKILAASAKYGLEVLPPPEQ
jgi:quercetin dioxygenase-like cupin family protein